MVMLACVPVEKHLTNPFSQGDVRPVCLFSLTRNFIAYLPKTNSAYYVDVAGGTITNMLLQETL